MKLLYVSYSNRAQKKIQNNNRIFISSIHLDNMETYDLVQRTQWPHSVIIYGNIDNIRPCICGVQLLRNELSDPILVKHYCFPCGHYITYKSQGSPFNMVVWRARYQGGLSKTLNQGFRIWSHRIFACRSSVSKVTPGKQI